MSGKPWLFNDTFLLSKIWNLIGNTIGKVIDVDMDANDIGWGKFLRVKVKLNLTKPLARV